MTKATHDNIIRLWGASLALILVCVVTGLVTYVLLDKRMVIRRSSEQMLLDATFAAVSLDAVLRKASLEIEAASIQGAPEGKTIASAAFGIQEADNIYLLDERGAVLDTAYNRRDASIDGAAPAFERLDAGAASDCRIVNAPAEGGEALALISIFPTQNGERRYAAILFTGFSMLGGLTALGSGSYESMELRDWDGKSLTIIEGKKTRANKTDPKLNAEVPLASVPILVSASSDKSLILAAWGGRIAILAAMVAIFGAILSGMFIYGLRLWRRANSAARLQKELEHQDLLFREVNHRIKNNLSIIITVLKLGADKIAERPDSAETTLESAIDRVYAIALLHELLYKKPQSLRDDFGAYIESLSNALSETYGQGGLIAIKETHDADVRFNLDKAVPLALMVNEIVTNAYKHAFPKGRKGTIFLKAMKKPDGGVQIQVTDDGIGMEDGKPDSGGIGTMLIDALAGQLNATITRQGNQPNGTSWTIQMPSEPIPVPVTS